MNIDINIIKNRIIKLRKYIDELNHYYYVLNESKVSDFEFDSILNELKDLEKNNPQFNDPYSPTKRVGGSVDKFNSVKHLFPMLSLSNTYSDEDLFNYDKRIRKNTQDKIEYVCELKFDGVSISVIYENGKFKRAITRGDGASGDDVSLNIKTIKSIPMSLKGDFPDKVELRGEIFISKKDFEKLNQARTDKGLVLYSNPRNTASGSIKLLDPKEVNKRPLDCFFYSVSGESLKYNLHYENLLNAKEWGFKISNHTEKHKSIQDVIKYVNKWEKLRISLPYETDGVVVKVNNIQTQNLLGHTSKFPRWATAYKFKTEQVFTKLKEITYQVGRTGAVTPIANLSPVKISGTIVKRASLHNADQIERFDIRKGDFVFVEKGGEIIPKIVGVKKDSRDLFSQPTTFIDSCPECGSKLIRRDGESHHYCINHNFCPPQIKGKFEHFISRGAMNIDGIGPETIDLLFKNNLIKNISDLYSLDKSKLISLEGVADKSIENLSLSLQRSKEKPFSKVLYSLGIRHIGETMSKKLTNYYNNIDDLLNESYDNLVSKKEVGHKIAESIINFAKNEDNINLIEKLKNIGLNFSEEPSEQYVSNKLFDYSFVISGVFDDFSRREMGDFIESHQGKVSSSISKKSSFLLIGVNPGDSKIKKANDFGIKIIKIDQLLNMLK